MAVYGACQVVSLTSLCNTQAQETPGCNTSKSRTESAGIKEGKSTSPTSRCRKG
jgi:hypothetical protein